MSEELSPEALDYLAFLEESEYPIRYKEGLLSKELIEADLAEVCKREITVPASLMSPTTLIPQSFLVPTTVYQDFLTITQEGIVYLREHREDLERRAEA